MKNYSIDEIKKVLETKDFKFFDGGPFDLNFIFIRSKNSKSNKFDDLATPIWFDDKGIWNISYYPCTTDPGKNTLLAPLNKNGTIITVPGQYPKSHKLGYHNRSKGASRMYEAFEQCNEMTYVRDNSKDDILDFSLCDNPKNHFTGIMKTNVHRASKWKILEYVGLYSAGCTVLQNPIDFNFMIWLGHQQMRFGFGQFYTQTILKEEWFN